MTVRLSKGLPRLLITLTVAISTLLLMLSLRSPSQSSPSLQGRAAGAILDLANAAPRSSLEGNNAPRGFAAGKIATKVTSAKKTGSVSGAGATQGSPIVYPGGIPPIPTESLMFTLNEPDICSDLRPEVFTLIYVHTAPSHFKHRSLIRRTYGNTQLYHKLRTVTVFFVGHSEDPLVERGVILESQRYHDIIQADYMDTYKNLSLKAVSALKWIQEHCMQASYVLKADDDMFVNVFNLVRHLNFLTKYQKGDRHIHCLVWYNMEVIRDAKSKWFVSPKEFVNNTFPPYCSGSAFFMPSAVAPLLYDAAKRAPFLWVDDAYATGILARYGDVQHNSISSIVVLKPEDYDSMLIKGEAVFGHMSGDKGVDLRHSYWTKVLQKEEAEVPEVAS